MSRQLCGELLADPRMDQKKHLAGWIENLRYLGQIIFISFRDRSGKLQLVLEPAKLVSGTHYLAQLTVESCIEVRGKLVHRPINQVKQGVLGGAYEFHVTEILDLHACAAVPVQTGQALWEPSENTLRYRYLLLRNPVLSNRVRKRAEFIQNLRHTLNAQGFCEVETPILSNSTPEGARDYLVPSRVHKGHCYALPQSPQLYKQLLMIGGLERYYQIARCFRDEDLRADRQPEFTQLDVEASFVSTHTLRVWVESWICETFSSTFQIDLPPFLVLTYREAMEQYGCDKPDLRFGAGIIDLFGALKACPFAWFQEAAKFENWGIFGLTFKKSEKPSRRICQEAHTSALRQGLKGILWLEVARNEQGALFFKNFPTDDWPDGLQSELCSRLKLMPSDHLAIVVGHAATASSFLGVKRTQWRMLCQSWAPLWVTQFPMFERTASGQVQSMHHPFTSPLNVEQGLNEPPSQWLADSYDMVLNGYEVGGGSRRIHDPCLQKRIFGLLGLSEQVQQTQFGFFLEALSYGAPTHAGIALGIDRLVMLGTGASNLRDVIAFPKTTSAACPMIGAPSLWDADALGQLGLQLSNQSAIR